MASREPELYLRWMQLASMTPFFRTHSAQTSMDRSPWSYGEPTTGRVRAVIERRYRLLAYLYTQAYRAATAGTPIVRPMFFEQPDVPGSVQVDDQFMLGDSLLVAPILEKGAQARTVDLPGGTWYQFQTGSSQTGARTITATAGWDLPIFVRAGAVIPLWPVRQSTSESVDRLTLDVYAGSASTPLYEDAGNGYGYQRGEFLISTFTTDLSDAGLDVSWTSNGSYVRPTPDVEVRVHGLRNVSRVATCDGASIPVHVEDDTMVLNTGPFRRLTLAN